MMRYESITKNIIFEIFILDIATWCKSKTIICYIRCIEKSARNTSWTRDNAYGVHNANQLLLPWRNYKVIFYIYIIYFNNLSNYLYLRITVTIIKIFWIKEIIRSKLKTSKYYIIAILVRNILTLHMQFYYYIFLFSLLSFLQRVNDNFI